MDRLFKAFYFGGMFVEMLVRLPYERQRTAIAKTDQRVTVTERGVLYGLFAALSLLPLVYTFTSWLRFANYPINRRMKRILGGLGIVSMGATLWLFWRSHRDLGTNWSPTLEIGAEHTLVTDGIYRRIRHPMYASGWMWGISQALLLQNWLAGFPGLVAFAVLYFLRVPNEERMMLDTFGDAYRAYSERTGRVLPLSKRVVVRKQDVT